MPMKPSGKIDLEHRAYFLAETSEDSQFVAASGDGHISLVDRSTNSVRCQRPTANLKAISCHPTEPILAYADGETGSISIQTLSGKLVTQLEPTHKLAKSQSTKGYSNCFFDLSGKYIWLATPQSDDECEISLLKTNDWSVTHRERIHDDFFASNWSFQSLRRPDSVSLYIAAGQDGQEVHFLKQKDGHFTRRRIDLLSNSTPPVFSPDSERFLTLNEENGICQFDFASMTRIGSEMYFTDEDDQFDTSMCYLDSQRLLVSTNAGRIFMVNADKMLITDEIALERHEPRPTHVYYPTLTDDNGIATDISWYQQLNRAIVFVFQRKLKNNATIWKDSLLWYVV